MLKKVFIIVFLLNIVEVKAVVRNIPRSSTVDLGEMLDSGLSGISEGLSKLSDRYAQRERERRQQEHEKEVMRLHYQQQLELEAQKFENEQKLLAQKAYYEQQLAAQKAESEIVAIKEVSKATQELLK